MRRALVTSVGLLLMVGLASAQSPGVHPVQRDLNAVGEKMQQERKMLERLEHQSTSLLHTVGDLDRQSRLAEEKYERNQKKLAQLEKQLHIHRDKQLRAVDTLDGMRHRLRRRVKSLYKLGDAGWLAMLFTARTAAEGVERLQLMRRLARADRDLIGDVILARQDLQAAQRQIETKKRALLALGGKVKSHRRQAMEALERKRQALRLVNQRKLLHQRAMTELQRARRRLVGLVSSIEGSGSAGSGFASWRGRLPWPVANGRTELGFGRQVDPRFGTVTVHKGVDIRAPRGTPVKAVYAGRVVFAGTFRGYGLLVIVDHGEGYYSLYAHLDSLRVKKGDSLRQAQVIGEVGETGSLKGAYLYFEIRQGGRAADPQGWLRRGRM